MAAYSDARCEKCEQPVGKKAYMINQIFYCGSCAMEEKNKLAKKENKSL